MHGICSCREGELGFLPVPSDHLEGVGRKFSWRRGGVKWDFTKGSNCANLFPILGTL